jgi:hypothetical protein
MTIFLAKNAEHIPILVTTSFEDIKKGLDEYCNNADSEFFCNDSKFPSENEYEGFFIYKANITISGVTMTEEKFHIYSMTLYKPK